MENSKNCLSCKLISICTLLVVGGYLVYRGKSQTSVSKYSMYTAGAVIGTMGVGEIFDKSPFR